VRSQPDARTADVLILAELVLLTPFAALLSDGRQA
jgi:hypothetical protein